MRGMLSLLWLITLIALVIFFVLLIIFVIDKVKQRDSSVSGRALITTLVMSLILLVTTCGADVGAKTARGISSHVEKSDNLAVSSDDDSTASHGSEIDVDVEPDDNIHTLTEVSPNIRELPTPQLISLAKRCNLAVKWSNLCQLMVMIKSSLQSMTTPTTY